MAGELLCGGQRFLVLGANMDRLIIRDLRRKAGLTQAEVACHLGVCNHTVNRWESGRHPMSRGTEGKFISLVNDTDMLLWFKAFRPARVYGRPFQKKNMLT